VSRIPPLTYPETLLKRLLEALPDALECDDFHHSKDDQHGYLEPCLAMKRYELARISARAYLEGRKGNRNAARAAMEEKP